MNNPLGLVSQLARHAYGIYRWGWRHPLEPYPRLLANYLFRSVAHEMCDWETLRQRRGSDTIFILASGPTLGNLTPAQEAHINACDSFGLNFSFVQERLIPTYYQMSFENVPWMPAFYKNLFRPLRERYSQTTFFVSTKGLDLCFYHPAFAPEHFSAHPKMHLYTLPPSIRFSEDRPFQDSDFEQTLFYRGTLSLVLHFAVQLGYAHIVLVGVDPETRNHFYSDLPSMRIVEEENAKAYAEQPAENQKFEYMNPKGARRHPMDVYFYAAEDYLRRRKGVQLYIWSPENMLHAGLPAYLQAHPDLI